MNLKLSTAAIFIMMAFCFLAFFVNVFYVLQNKKLSSDVGSYIDEKTDLRAKYLSGISAENLSGRADNLKMKQATDLETHTVTKKSFRKKSNNFIKQFMNDLDYDLKSV